jgi:hypothetical protein
LPGFRCRCDGIVKPAARTAPGRRSLREQQLFRDVIYPIRAPRAYTPEVRSRWRT